MAIQWSLVLFTVITGAAGWTMASLACDLVRGVERTKNFQVATVSLIALMIGGLASVTHLSHPDRIMGALGHPTSGIFTEAVLIGITALLVVIYMVVLKRGASKGAAKCIAVLAAIFGIVLSFLAGYSYLMGSRPTWNTILLPLGYMATVIPAGVALYLLVQETPDDANTGFQGTFMAVGGIVAAVVAAAYGTASGSFGSVALSLGGLSTVVGGILPAICGLMIKKNPAKVKALSAVALVCAAVGAIGFRVAMWQLGVPINNFFG